MSNYYATTRSNYFHIKDETKFRALMAEVVTESGDNISIFEKDGKNGDRLFGFGCFSEIEGIYAYSPEVNNDPEASNGSEMDYSLFINRLQSCIPEGDAAIIMEVGYEKLCYVTGTATIVTSTDVRYVDIANEAVKEAKKILGLENWETQMEY